jgi:hypothetical protein
MISCDKFASSAWCSDANLQNLAVAQREEGGVSEYYVYELPSITTAFLRYSAQLIFAPEYSRRATDFLSSCAFLSCVLA